MQLHTPENSGRFPLIRERQGGDKHEEGRIYRMSGEQTLAKGSDFSGAKVVTGTGGGANPFNLIPGGVAPIGAFSHSDATRTQAEVQAAMVAAKMYPRDEFIAYEKIMKACKRKTLAEQASYAFPRGGETVTGPRCLRTAGATLDTGLER
jgi:hypothetical protein